MSIDRLSVDSSWEQILCLCNASISLRPLQPLRPPCNCRCCRALNPALDSMYLDWLERWDRPSCWTALSALHASSTVRCTRRRPLPALVSACRDIPTALQQKRCTFISLLTESGDSLSFNCRRNSTYTRPVYCPSYCTVRKHGRPVRAPGAVVFC